MKVDIKAKKYVFIADDNSCFAEIVETCKNIRADDGVHRLFRYLKKSEEKITTKKGAYLEKSVAHMFLSRLLCNLKYLFEQHFLFIANLEYTDVHYSTSKGFVCHLKLPYVSNEPVFTESHISQVERSKRAALQDAAFKSIKGLMACGCLDENLSLIKEYFIINKVYKSWLESTYKIENSYLDQFDMEYQKNINSIDTYPLEYFFSVLNQKETNEQPVFITHVYSLIFKLMQHVVNGCDSTYVKNVFKQKYMVTLKKANLPKIKSRAIPKCFLNLNMNHLYAFSSDMGIICGKTFRETIKLENTSFVYLGEVDLDDQQMSLIALYNVLFFGLHYKKIGYNSTYNYFAVPLQDKKLFLNGFLGNLYENQEYVGYLLFNPFNKNFYVFKDWSDQSINDNAVQIENGPNINDDLLRGEDDNDNGEFISYLKYFEQKYGTHLKYTDDNDKRLMFNGYIYSHRGKGTATTSLLSSEIMRVTPCTKDVFEKYTAFTQNFIYFEVLALVDEAKNDLNLPISLKLLSNCFISKNDKYPDYERLEFLGDCILKYLVTKFFMLCFEYDTGLIVDSKCRIIENSNLTLIGRKLKLESYFSNLVFQPPSLSENICKQLQQYFNFKNTAFNSQTTICSQISSEKTYADIVEAIIGACYVENGLNSTEKMIFRLGIIDMSKYSDSIIGVFEEADSVKNEWKKQKINTDKFLRDIFELDGDASMDTFAKTKTFDFSCYLENCNNGTFFRCNRFLANLAEYHNVMSEEHIMEVEKILNYKFRNKGFIEKAMIHPSTRDKMFGTRSYFEKLELIGDSILDVFVTKSIFNEYSCPFALHEARKNLVNNQIYGNVLYTSKLFHYIETCFDKDELRDSYLVNNYKKLYGDIFEAINGAILLDLDCRADLYEKIWESRIKEWLWSCHKIRKTIE
ncbi:dsRNA-specific nuclease Dicer, ribonuclease [Trachipleistophora hominis]|uniref:DsRNA-specific nuclease Dicer, ribonuclease n=1 Tax=Trachipleistophora hominis TaxID=72359 RepID=L7JU04_TRAHO|nr:dsRNA-specific nuclease Dicer, ribonuclease [Trachipleistophora hominis]